MTQGGEQLGQPLRFVHGNCGRVRLEEALEVRGQQSEVGGTLEIEVGPLRESMACESALAALPRPNQEDGGKRTEEGFESLSA